MNNNKIHQALHQYFGYTSFRPMQEDIIHTVLSKKDTLVLMPTGGGKSICYQIPALVLDGLTIVISPLISLMKDQVESLKRNGVKAAYINSSQGSEEQYNVQRMAEDGLLKLLYISPEKLFTENFQFILSRIHISLLAVDEAHCISAWGHDFRPEYTKLKHFKQEYPHIPIIALTATADKLTRQDIIEQLALKKAEIFIASFDRPNLNLNVLPGQGRFDTILSFLDKHPSQAGIIYCLSRKSTEKIAQKLSDKGYKALAYHAGIDQNKREKTQENFLNDNISIICATVAFGMGIDKSNVRWVIHYNLPKNMESYYQEIGRAGRDGLQSDTLLFYSYADIMQLKNFINKNEQKQVNEAKLNRMQQYAESFHCRRKIILSYFGQETTIDNCGNCDNCINKPIVFDGTIIAQKALSAIARVQQQVGIAMLIDILRGSNRQEIILNQYHKVKTYGTGKDMSYLTWQQYIQQLIQIGCIEIAYQDKNKLRLTPLSKKILYENKKIDLVSITSFKEKIKTQYGKKPTSQKQQNIDKLFDILKKKRKEMAASENIPPYLIFNDATLKEMATSKPINEQEMQHISGVGYQKLKQYGDIFIHEIMCFITQEKHQKVLKDGTTYKTTLLLYQQGFSVNQIAQKRGLHVNTIYSHIVHLYEKKTHGIDLLDHIDIDTIHRIQKANTAITREKNTLKPLFDYFEEKIPYYKIRLALAYIQANEK